MKSRISPLTEAGRVGSHLLSGCCPGGREVRGAWGRARLLDPSGGVLYDLRYYRLAAPELHGLHFHDPESPT